MIRDDECAARRVFQSGDTDGIAPDHSRMTLPQLAA
jgi:hypothetical protein